jgi:hypothetical protein
MKPIQFHPTPLTPLPKPRRVKATAQDSDEDLQDILIRMGHAPTAKHLSPQTPPKNFERDA